MDLTLILILVTNVERLRFLFFEKSRLCVIDAFLNMHTDDLLKVVVNIVFVAELFRNLLRVVIFKNRELLLLPISNLYSNNQQLSLPLLILFGLVRVELSIWSDDSRAGYGFVRSVPIWKVLFSQFVNWLVVNLIAL